MTFGSWIGRSLVALPETSKSMLQLTLSFDRGMCRNSLIDRIRTLGADSSSEGLGSNFLWRSQPQLFLQDPIYRPSKLAKLSRKKAVTIRGVEKRHRFSLSFYTMRVGPLTVTPIPDCQASRTPGMCTYWDFLRIPFSSFQSSPEAMYSGSWFRCASRVAI